MNWCLQYRSSEISAARCFILAGTLNFFLCCLKFRLYSLAKVNLNVAVLCGWESRFNSELKMCCRIPEPNTCLDAILSCMTNESEGVFKHVLSSLDQYGFILCLYLLHNTYCWVGRVCALTELLFKTANCLAIVFLWPVSSVWFWISELRCLEYIVVPMFQLALLLPPSGRIRQKEDAAWYSGLVLQVSVLL